MKKFNLGRIALTLLNILIILLMGFMLFRAAPVVLGAGTISLDGNFDDWSGQSCIGDPTGDAVGPETDITQFCFATNAGQSNAYFMLERLDAGSGGKPLNMTLYIDSNNNGSYETQADINDKANKNSGDVSVNGLVGGQRKLGLVPTMVGTKRNGMCHFPPWALRRDKLFRCTSLPGRAAMSRTVPQAFNGAQRMHLGIS